MKLAIADPPYLGRADRWYGNGRGHASGRGRADHHDEAHTWDKPETHRELLCQLEAEYDGWAYACAPDSLPVLEPAIPANVRRMIWHRVGAIASGSRLRSTYEIVLARIPEGRRAHGTGLAVDDVLSAGINTHRGFAGAKPEAWTRWVLAALGYQPQQDEVIDLFPGSGAVTGALDGLLPIPAF